ncbi:MAG: ABC transporter permease [Pseudomonadota bacterium]
MHQSNAAHIRHLRVLHALIVREMITRYGRSALGYVWAVLEPAGVILLLTLLFEQIAHAPPYGKSFALFYATGYLGFHWVLDISNVCSRSIHVNRPLLSFPSVTALDTILARFILQLLTAIAVAGLILGVIFIASGEPFRPRAPDLLLAFTLAALLGLGIGSVNAWAFAISRGWEVAWGVISRPLLLVSCVFYSFESLPREAQDVLWFNPVVHVVGLLRGGVYPVYDGGHLVPLFPFAVALSLIVIGLVSLRMARARIVLP